METSFYMNEEEKLDSEIRTLAACVQNVQHRKCPHPQKRALLDLGAAVFPERG